MALFVLVQYVTCVKLDSHVADQIMSVLSSDDPPAPCSHRIGVYYMCTPRPRPHLSPPTYTLVRRRLTLHNRRLSSGRPRRTSWWRHDGSGLATAGSLRLWFGGSKKNVISSLSFISLWWVCADIFNVEEVEREREKRERERRRPTRLLLFACSFAVCNPPSICILRVFFKREIGHDDLPVCVCVWSMGWI